MISLVPRLGCMWDAPACALCHASVAKSGVAPQPQLWYNVGKAGAEARFCLMAE